MNNLGIGDVVKRAGVDESRVYSIEIGDVVAKDGARCQVKWRDRQAPNFYRPEEMVTRKGKKTWVREDRLILVEAYSCLTAEEKAALEGLI
jgi:hypothetical protein